MKYVSPKSLSVSAIAVSVAFISGMAVMAHPAALQPQPLTGTKVTAVTVADPTTTTTTTDPAATTTTASTATQTAPAPADPTTSATSSTATTTSTTTTTTTAPTAPAAPAAPVVTAVDAQLGTWGDPQPTPSITTYQGQPLASFVQYRYCTWTYSDGSTQQAAAESKYSTEKASDGTQFSSSSSITDCTVANAPAAN